MPIESSSSVIHVARSFLHPNNGEGAIGCLLPDLAA
jgi:hypothetical protein